MPSLLTVPTPSSDTGNVDCADWVEASTLFRDDRTVSRDDLAKAITRQGYLRLDAAREFAADVFNELSDREESLSGVRADCAQYPFSLQKDGMVLEAATGRRDGNMGLVYRFLLLVSRADMSQARRVLRNVDPTKVFERLGAEVLLEFWGGKSSRSDAKVFGTSAYGRETTFRQRINELCEDLGQGGGYSPTAAAPGGGDGRLDIVVWRRFSDQRTGGMIGFAQCKTGVHWAQHTTKLQPRTFVNKFFRDPLKLKPLRMYLVPHRIESQKWSETSDDAGLLLDRCRIAEYSSRASAAVLTEMRIWVNEAIARQERLMQRR